MRMAGLAMNKTLKVDNDFVPCPANIGDELFPNGIFEFNITKKRPRTTLPSRMVNGARNDMESRAKIIRKSL